MIKDEKLYEFELCEFEFLLICKYEKTKFEPIIYEQETNLVFIRNNELVEVLEFYFPGRYKIDDSGNVVMSMEIFKILQSRYFRENKTVCLKPTSINK